MYTYQYNAMLQSSKSAVYNPMILSAHLRGKWSYKILG